MSPEARLAIAAFRIATTVHLYRKNRKYFKRIETMTQEFSDLTVHYSEAVAIVHSQNAQITYLQNMLAENGIAPDEFDIIALNNPIV